MINLTIHPSDVLAADPLPHGFPSLCQSPTATTVSRTWALKEIFDCRSVTDSTRGAGYFLPKVVLTSRQYVLSYYLTEDERLNYDNYSYTETDKLTERKNDNESKYAFW